MSPDKKVDVVAAPMSFAGAFGRTMNLFWNGRDRAYRLAVGWWAVYFTLAAWWSCIFVWYIIFGIFLIPYRLIRRGSRKRKIEARRHDEMLEAIRSSQNN